MMCCFVVIDANTQVMFNDLCRFSLIFKGDIHLDLSDQYSNGRLIDRTLVLLNGQVTRDQVVASFLNE